MSFFQYVSREHANRTRASCVVIAKAIMHEPKHSPLRDWQLLDCLVEQGLLDKSEREDPVLRQRAKWRIKYYRSLFALPDWRKRLRQYRAGERLRMNLSKFLLHLAYTTQKWGDTADAISVLRDFLLQYEQHRRELENWLANEEMARRKEEEEPEDED